MSAEKLGPPLNIDRVLNARREDGSLKTKNRINLVGVELEGGWTKLPGDLRPQRDGSIHLGIAGDDEIKVSQLKHIGEIPLPPLSVKEFPATMKIYYPHMVNATCGMHVHISTNRAFCYQRLMINHPYSYPGTIVEYVRRWAEEQGLPKKHAIWPRLQNKSEYCQHLFQAEEQVKTANKDFDHHRNGHRYTVIGYCWSRFKTLECRLLPMMESADLGIKAVQAIIDITNAFLVVSKEREPRLRAGIHEDGDIEIEERRSFV